MDDLKNVTDIVYEILVDHEETRNSDDYLYYRVCKRLLRFRGISVDSVQFVNVILNRKVLGLPCYETVRRTRQKIQQHHPELEGCKEVEAARAENEIAFRDYARRKL